MGILQRLRRSLGLDEEFGLPGDPKVVVGAARGLALAAFDDDLARVMQQSRLIFNIPPESLEKRRYEVHAHLGLGVGFGQVMRLVGVELGDELYDLSAERVKGGSQGILRSRAGMLTRV